MTTGEKGVGVKSFRGKAYEGGLGGKENLGVGEKAISLQGWDLGGKEKPRGVGVSRPCESSSQPPA